MPVFDVAVTSVKFFYLKRSIFTQYTVLVLTDIFSFFKSIVYIRVMCLFINQEFEISIFSLFYKFCYFPNGYRELLACRIREN